VDRCLSVELQYACVYWVQHLLKGGVALSDDGDPHAFFKEHFLHWLESLSWLGKSSESIHAIRSLQLLALVS
jgi:hypothetical protein